MKLSFPAESEGLVPFSRENIVHAQFNVLIVSSNDQPHLLLHHLLEPAGWKVRSCFSLAEAVSCQWDCDFAVILCEGDLKDGGWRELFNESRRAKRPARVVVFSAYADVALWAEVLNVGGYDVLMYPFEPKEIVTVTKFASESWAREGIAAAHGTMSRARTSRA